MQKTDGVLYPPEEVSELWFRGLVPFLGPGERDLEMASILKSKKQCSVHCRSNPSLTAMLTTMFREHSVRAWGSDKAALAYNLNAAAHLIEQLGKILEWSCRRGFFESIQR